MMPKKLRRSIRLQRLSSASLRNPARWAGFVVFGYREPRPLGGFAISETPNGVYMNWGRFYPRRCRGATRRKPLTGFMLRNPARWAGFVVSETPNGVYMNWGSFNPRRCQGLLDLSLVWFTVQTQENRSDYQRTKGKNTGNLPSMDLWLQEDCSRTWTYERPSSAGSRYNS